MTSPAFVGTRPQRPREPAYNRDSNALRASVLDVAWQLGIGTSPAVERLMFDSVLEEEEENSMTPALTSASAATSDESWPSVPAWGGIPTDFVLPVRKVTNVAPPLSSELQVTRPPSEDSQASIVPRPSQPRKLRKARRDGYDSDGGYTSGNSNKKKDQKKGLGSTFELEYQSDGGYLSEAAKRGNDKKKKQKDKKGNKVADSLGVDPSIKMFPKSTKKSRMPSDDRELSEGAYLSEVTVKKKKTFFRLRSRSPSVSRKGSPNDTPPPVPPISLPISAHFTRGPPSGATTPLRAAHSPEPPMLVPSLSPPSESLESNSRSLSLDASSENCHWSAISHEIGRHSPASYPVQTLQVTPHVPPSHKPETRAPSPAHVREQTSASAPAALRPHGVRFTPSTHFESTDSTSHMPLSPLPWPPSPVPSILRTASPVPAPSESRPFISRTLRPTPSPLMLTPYASPIPHGIAPGLSESSIVSSSEFIFPNPRPRFFEDLPPPSPPRHARSLTFHLRDSAFPPRGILPVQEASRLIERTERTRQEARQARLAELQAEALMKIQAESMGDVISDDVHGDDPAWLAEGVSLVPPSPQPPEDDYDWPDDESVRPDIAQFYLYAPSSPSGGAGEVATRLSPDVPDDERSTYTYSYAASSSSVDMNASAMTPPTHLDTHSRYSEERRVNADFIDDEPSNMRARLNARADVLYGAEKIPPVPKLRPF
ncbi:hypothetical protein BC826DRAFT_1084281 [Russula brevipes]|nr:hypothetical protein BC826DRAFT_1084281 [Russula brevipes]